MQNREKMTSKRLQDEFEYLYSSFFSDHPIVSCVNNCFEWTPSFGYTNYKLIINQKVPTKTYCGMKKSKDGIILINSIYNYDCKNNKREQIDGSFGILNYLEILDYIGNYLKANGINEGLIIDFISENPKGHGFGFTCASCTCIACGLIALTEGLGKEKNISNDGEIKNKIYKMAWEMSLICSGGKSDGSGCYNNINKDCMTIGSIYDYENNNGKDKGIDTNFTKRIQETLNQYLGFDNKWNGLPIDYGIIFSGKQNRTEKTQLLIDNFKNKLNQVKDNIKNINSKLGYKDSTSKFNKHIGKDFNNLIDDYICILSYKTTLGFKNLLENPYDELYSNEFINIINENGRFCEFIEKENHLSKTFRIEFDKNKTFEDEVVGTERIDLGKIGGSFLFVTKYNKGRNTILKTVQNLKDMGYENIHIEYLSRQDGDESNGIEIIQNIYQGNFSDFVDKDYVISKDVGGGVNMGKYTEIISNNKDKLILDGINKKIYYNGEKINSKLIHSQSSTVEILGMLINNLDKEINNKNIGISSYSKNKNEMMGKIILPLNRFVHTNFGLKLPLTCKGGLNDFYIKLNSCEKRIIYIDKISN